MGHLQRTRRHACKGRTRGLEARCPPDESFNMNIALISLVSATDIVLLDPWIRNDRTLPFPRFLFQTG